MVYLKQDIEEIYTILVKNPRYYDVVWQDMWLSVLLCDFLIESKWVSGKSLT